MKSAHLRDLDIVPAPLLPSPSAAVAHELHSMLGDAGEARLRHLMDGRPVHAPGFHAGDGVVTSPLRSPRARFLAGPLRQDPLTGEWSGPVLLDSEPWRATYVALEHLAHEDCATCSGVWLRAAGWTQGFVVEDAEVMPGVGARVAVPPLAVAETGLRTA